MLIITFQPGENLLAQGYRQRDAVELAEINTDEATGRTLITLLWTEEHLTQAQDLDSSLVLQSDSPDTGVYFEFQSEGCTLESKKAVLEIRGELPEDWVVGRRVGRWWIKG